jgi:hypothetical protein
MAMGENVEEKNGTWIKFLTTLHQVQKSEAGEK